MPRLIVLRHAKSAWPDGVPDYRRPLADRGRRDAPEAGRWLADNAPAPDAVLVSPATRTRQTWELVAPHLPTAAPPVYEDQLYGEGAPAIAAVLRDLPPTASTVLLIGHNPDLEDLVASLTGTRPTLKTTTLADLTCTPDFTSATLTTTARLRG